MWQSVALSGTVPDRIAQQITKLITAEEIKPGDRLPSERDLAMLLGVSRPSVREAVKALEAQGRLRVRHGQGVFVAVPAAEQELRAALADQDLTLSELFWMREVLEVPAAGSAAAAAAAGGQDWIAAAAAALEDLNQASAATPADIAAIQQLDAAFHMRIAEAVGNRFLRQTLSVLQEQLAAAMQGVPLSASLLARARAEHERILDSLRRGDAVAAKQAARRHIRSAHTIAQRRTGSENAEPAGV